MVTFVPKREFYLLRIVLPNQLLYDFFTSAQHLFFFQWLCLTCLFCQFHPLSGWIVTSSACSLLLKWDLWLRLQFKIFISNLTLFSFLKNNFLPTVFISLKYCRGLSGHQTNLNLIVSLNSATLLRKHWQKPCL